MAELRWWCFTKMQQQNDQLPPTKGSLYPALQRARLQLFIWNSSHIPKSDVLNPTDFGWQSNEAGHLIPVFCTQDCAPPEILNLVRCGCKKNKCNTKRCKCVTNQLKCTEMCECEASEELCENLERDSINLDNGDSSEEEEEDEEIVL